MSSVPQTDYQMPTWIQASKFPFSSPPGRWAKRGCLVLCSLLLLSVAAAQGPYYLPDKKKRVAVPFSFHRNLIILEAYLNQKGPYNFMIDSGLGISLITDPSLRDSVQLSDAYTVKVVGAGEDQPIEALVSSKFSMDFNGIQGRNLTMAILSEDVLSLSNYIGIPIHGIIGFDFFRSFVVDINFNEAVMHLHQFETYHHPIRGRARELPITIEYNKPYLVARGTLNDSVSIPLKLVVDTGAGHGLSLEMGSHEQITMPHPALRAQLGRGLAGAINGHFGRVKQLKLDSFVLRQVITSYPDHRDVQAKLEQVQRNGNLGNEVLKRFRVVFDYHRHRIILRPAVPLRLPFEHDMSGLHILAEGKGFRRFVAYRIEPNSPAEAAGLAAGDEILSINLQPATTMTIMDVEKLLRSKDQRTLFVEVRRGTIKFFVMLTLQRQI